MYQRLSYRILALIGFALVSATVTLGQSLGETEVITLNRNDTWQGAQLIGSSKSRAFNKLLVVTLDQPHHRQPCRILSFTMEKLVCSRASEVLAPFCRSKLPPSSFPVTDVRSYGYFWD